MPSLNLPGGNAGRAKTRAKAKGKAAETRSKEEDNQDWISILGTARRESHEITQEVTRHRLNLNLVSTFETPGLANMAVTVDGAMTLM